MGHVMPESTTERTIHSLRRPASGAAAALLMFVTACSDDAVASATDETTTTTTTTLAPTTSSDSETSSTGDETTTTSPPTTSDGTTGTTDPIDSTSTPVTSTTDVDDTSTSGATATTTTGGETTTTTGGATATTTTTGGETTTTTGGPGVCEPRATEDCYGGPDGTLDVGVCKAGIRTCADDGTGFGPCVGEVTPGAEDCSTPADENCLGDVPECGAALWVKQFGGPLGNEASALAVGPDDGVAITGRFYGALDFGGGPLVSAGLWDGYLARFDGDGGHLWSRRFGSPGQEYGRAVAFDATGGVVLTANIEGSASLGGDTLTSVGGQDLAVARYDAGGDHQWSTIYEGPEHQIGLSCAVDSHDDVILGGVFAANFELGAETLVSQGAYDNYLAKLDGDGAYLWAEGFGNADHQYAGHTVVDGDDNLLQAGYFAGQLDYGGGPMLAAGANDVFVAKLDGDGEYVWNQRFGDGGDQRIEALAVDAAGRVLVGGRFDGVLDLGGDPLMHDGNFDAFVAVFDGDGAHVWSRRLGGPGSARVDAITADPAGNVIVGGVFNQTIDLGGGPVAAGPDTTAFLAKYDPAGNHLHSVILAGDGGDQWIYAAAADSAGHVVVLGTFTESIAIAGEALISAGGNDIFLAKLAL